MNWFVKLITFNWPTAITFAPFGIYIKEDYLEYGFIINHERIHWKQQMEMLLIFFYIWYLLEWIVKLFIYGRKAYRHLTFEKEAYGNDHNNEYLSNREPYAWINYLRK